MLGFGLDSVVKITCDADGRIIPEEFEKAIEACIQEGSVINQKFSAKYYEKKGGWDTV